MLVRGINAAFKQRRTLQHVSMTVRHHSSFVGRDAVKQKGQHVAAKLGALTATMIAAGITVSCAPESLSFTYGEALGSKEKVQNWLKQNQQVTLIDDASQPVGASVVALLTRMRDRSCTHDNFVRSVERIMGVLVEATAGQLEMKERVVSTPMGDKFTGMDWEKDVAVVSILRSGDAMLKGFLRAMPEAPSGSILISRDRTKPSKPHVVYYSKIPKGLKGRQVILMDPMLASGKTAELAIRELLEHGVRTEDLILVHLIITPEGVEHIAKTFPRVRIVAATLDSGIDEESKYIVPGVGCFGDRYFNETKSQQ